MASSKSSAPPAPARAGGRPNQRQRTRRSLIEAAIALSEGGRRPSFAEVAERAMVSRATAYRYYASAEALISEAMFERAVPAPREMAGDPVESIGHATREMNRLLLDDEVGLHVMERSFMAVWLEHDAASRPQRPGRRLRYIRPVLDALKEELTPPARKRLGQALAMVMGTEAVLALRDIAGASRAEALAASVWAAQALVRQARAEAKAERRAPRRPRSG